MPAHASTAAQAVVNVVVAPQVTLPSTAITGILPATNGWATMPSFQEALRTSSLEALRTISKSDLHNHAFGGGNRAWIARATEHDIAPLDTPLNSMTEMHEWVSSRVGRLFDGPKGRLTAFEASLIQAQQDGITRLEVGEDVWAITLFDDDAAKLTRGVRRIHAQTAPEIEWIPQLGMSRHCSVSGRPNG